MESGTIMDSSDYDLDDTGQDSAKKANASSSKGDISDAGGSLADENIGDGPHNCGVIKLDSSVGKEIAVDLPFEQLDDKRDAKNCPKVVVSIPSQDDDLIGGDDVQVSPVDKESTEVKPKILADSSLFMAEDINVECFEANEDMEPLLTVDDTESQSSDLLSLGTVSYDVVPQTGVEDDERSVDTISSDIKLDSSYRCSKVSNSSSLVNLLDTSLRETSLVEQCSSEGHHGGGTGSSASSCLSSPSGYSPKIGSLTGKEGPTEIQNYVDTPSGALELSQKSQAAPSNFNLVALEVVEECISNALNEVLKVNIDALYPSESTSAVYNTHHSLVKPELQCSSTTQSCVMNVASSVDEMPPLAFEQPEISSHSKSNETNLTKSLNSLEEDIEVTKCFLTTETSLIVSAENVLPVNAGTDLCSTDVLKSFKIIVTPEDPLIESLTCAVLSSSGTSELVSTIYSPVLPIQQNQKYSNSESPTCLMDVPVSDDGNNIPCEVTEILHLPSSETEINNQKKNNLCTVFPDKRVKEENNDVDSIKRILNLPTEELSSDESFEPHGSLNELSKEDTNNPQDYNQVFNEEMYSIPINSAISASENTKSLCSASTVCEKNSQQLGLSLSSLEPVLAEQKFALPLAHGADPKETGLDVRDNASSSSEKHLKRRPCLKIISSSRSPQNLETSELLAKSIVDEIIATASLSIESSGGIHGVLSPEKLKDSEIVKIASTLVDEILNLAISEASQYLKLKVFGHEEEVSISCENLELTPQKEEVSIPSENLQLIPQKEEVSIVSDNLKLTSSKNGISFAMENLVLPPLKEEVSIARENLELQPQEVVSIAPENLELTSNTKDISTVTEDLELKPKKEGVSFVSEVELASQNEDVSIASEDFKLTPEIEEISFASENSELTSQKEEVSIANGNLDPNLHLENVSIANENLELTSLRKEISAASENLVLTPLTEEVSFGSEDLKLTLKKREVSFTSEILELSSQNKDVSIISKDLELTPQKDVSFACENLELNPQLEVAIVSENLELVSQKEEVSVASRSLELEPLNSQDCLAACKKDNFEDVPVSSQDLNSQSFQDPAIVSVQCELSAMEMLDNEAIDKYTFHNRDVFVCGSVDKCKSSDVLLNKAPVESVDIKPPEDNSVCERSDTDLKDEEPDSSSCGSKSTSPECITTSDSARGSLQSTTDSTVQREVSLFVDGVIEMAVKRYEDETSSSSESSPIRRKRPGFEIEFSPQEVEELATPCGEMITEHFMDFESGRNVSVFCSTDDSSLTSCEHLSPFDRVVHTIGNREVDSDTGKSVSVFRSDEDIFYEIQRGSTCTSVFESVEEEDEDMVDDYSNNSKALTENKMSLESDCLDAVKMQTDKDTDAFEDAVDAFLEKERLARDELRTSATEEELNSSSNEMDVLGRNEFRRRQEMDFQHFEEAVCQSVSALQCESDLSSKEEKRLMAERWANGVPDTPEMHEKKKAIRDALDSENDVATKLCKLALTEGGLIDDALRKEAWPRMLGLDPTAEVSAPSLDDLKSHPEYEQVVLDVNRSLKRFPPDIPRDQRETLQDKLTRLIMFVISKHPHLRYYQGYHDVAVTFLLVVGEAAALQIMERLSTEHLSDCMQPTMERTSYLLHFIYPLLHRLHPALAEYLERSEVGTMFCLPWFLTWFGHSLNRYQDVVRLYDHFLASPPLAPLYLAAVLVAHRADEVLAVDCDMAAIHALLSNIPDTLPLEILLRDATDLYQKYPPESIEKEVEERFKNEQDTRLHEMEVRERRRQQRALQRRHGSGSWQLVELQQRVGPAMMLFNRWIPPWVVQQQRLSMRLLFASATFFVGFYVYARGDVFP